MVERIPKVEVDRMRVQRKEDAADDQQSGGQPDQQTDEEEKKSRFTPKLDFKKAMGEESAAPAPHQTLWQRPTVTKRETPPHQTGSETTAEAETIEAEEVTHSTTITFLRAVGLVRMSGRLNWATVSLYAFALIGFVSTVIFLLNALL
jgi:nitric oxide reductase activation protein